MLVQILGGGCANCHKLEENVRKALAEAGIEAQVEKITNFARISAMGVMSTPALAIDGAVKSTGRVLSPAQIKEILLKQEQ